GADQAALQLVDTLPTADAIEAYVDEVLAEGGRLPGMGHREYRVRDPRAVFLERWAERLATAPQHAETLWRLKTLDRVFRQRMQALGKDVHANVEFYKGLVYRVIGLPDEYFTAAFGMARVFGYLAHVLENNEDSRIYRPAAQYVGQSCAT
ncbi:MAG: citrate/2-methylcitrate synthase, partial [Pseudomonadota bacterium]